jgi:hypothetical protein
MPSKNRWTPDQEKVEASMEKLKEKMEETIKHQMQHFLSCVDKIMQNLPEATKTVPNTEMMQSTVEHQEFPMGEATVRPVKGLSKRCRVWKLAAEHHQKLKEETRGYCELRRRVMVAAMQEWHGGKENSSGNVGPRTTVGH